MMDRIRKADREALAWGSVALAVIFFLALNALSNTVLTSTQLDLTEDGLYTLSDGTKEVLASVEEPIDIRFYYSKQLDEIGPDIARHAKRVRELLQRYEQLSDGMVRVEEYDPQPFSPEEDLAVSDGLQGLPIDQSGAKAYFGVAGINSTDDVAAIGYVAPERSAFLEYDLTRLISNLANPEKAVVTILTDLPMQGTQFDNYKAWQIVSNIQQFFTVKFIAKDAVKLPEDTRILMIAGAHTIKDELLYDIDQFVMNGGRVLAFVDPYAEAMALAGPTAGQLPPPGVAQAALEPLLNAWGVTVERGKFVANADDAIRVGFDNPETGQQVAVDYVAWLNLQGQGRFNRDDAVSAQLQRVVMSSTGAFMPAEGAQTSFEPLMMTTKDSQLMSAFTIAQQPNPIAMLDRFESADTSFDLAARVSGPVVSAFPDGPPEAVLSAAENDAARQAIRDAHRNESAEPLNAILVGDADMLTDRNWASVRNLAGQEIVVPTANNADFAVNALDNLRGAQGLVALRGRGLSVRPFEVIDAMKREADEQFRAKEQELQARLEEMESTIRELQQREQTTGVVMTAAQQEEIEKFRAQMLDLRSQLREVQHSLREDVETLQSRIRALNIWAVPVLVALLAIALAIGRRIRRARFHRAALH